MFLWRNNYALFMVESSILSSSLSLMIIVPASLFSIVPLSLVAVPAEQHIRLHGIHSAHPTISTTCTKVNTSYINIIFSVSLRCLGIYRSIMGCVYWPVLWPATSVAASSVRTIVPLSSLSSSCEKKMTSPHHKKISVHMWWMVSDRMRCRRDFETNSCLQTSIYFGDVDVQYPIHWIQ